MSKPKIKIRPIVECKRCRKSRPTLLLWVMICESCYLNEPKTNCGVCGKEKRFVTDGGGICPKCTRASVPTEIECAGCGKKKRPAKRGGKYCKQCQMRVNFGRGVCSGCTRDQNYTHKTKRLCGRCALNHWAPNRLRTFIETIRISDEYNLALFRHLTGLINWKSVNEEDRFQIYDFGRFLQSHKFEEPLSWGSIRKLRTALSGASFRGVRSCLEQLGKLLLDPAKDEDLNEGMGGINPLVPIASLHEDLIAVFKKYDLWLRTERKNTPKSRRNHFDTLGGFWRWCANRGLMSLDMVTATHVEEYLHTLGLKWKCRRCSSTKNLTSRGEVPPTVCENWECRALDSSVKVIRCVERSVDGHRAALRVFFGWLKDVEGGIESNPAPAGQRRKGRTKKRGRRRTRKVKATIQYYDWEVVDALLKDLEDPKMPAEEAMVLYFLLHHAFYLRELQTVQIPSQCRPVALGAAPRESLEDVLRLEWRQRKLSRQRQFHGRTGEMLQVDLAGEPWLRDLVGRFIRERNQKLRDPKNPYLFVGSRGRSRAGPVGSEYIRSLVESATARITGRVCTADILGKCSRLLYAEFGGHEGFRHLRELGLGDRQAHTYAWAKRVRVVPKPANRNKKKYPRQRKSNLTVPPIDVFGIPTDPGHVLGEDQKRRSELR